GRDPLVVDHTNALLYFYSGAWKKLTPGGGKCILGFGGLVGAATGAMTRFGNGGDASLAVDDVSSEIEITSAGTIQNLRVDTATTVVAASTITYTVRKNGADTGIT